MIIELCIISALAYLVGNLFMSQLFMWLAVAGIIGMTLFVVVLIIGAIASHWKD